MGLRYRGWMNFTLLTATVLSTVQVNNSSNATAAASLKNFSIENVCLGDTAKFPLITDQPCTHLSTRLFNTQGESVDLDSFGARFTKNESGVLLHGVKMTDQGFYTMVKDCIPRKYSKIIFLRVNCETKLVYEGTQKLKLQTPLPTNIYNAKDFEHDSVFFKASNGGHKKFTAVSKGNITDEGITYFDNRLMLDPNNTHAVELYNIRKSDEGIFTFSMWWITKDGIWIRCRYTFFLIVLDPTVQPPIRTNHTSSRPHNATTNKTTTVPTTANITVTTAEDGSIANAKFNPTRGPFGGGSGITVSMSCMIVDFLLAFIAKCFFN